MPSPLVYDVPEPMHELVTTVCAPNCTLGDRDGQIRPRGAAGLFVADTRVLHGARVEVDGAEPVGLGWTPRGPSTVSFHGVVRDLGDATPDPTVRIDRTRTVRADGMDETIRIRSTAADPVHATLTLCLTPDGTSLDNARAGRRDPAVPVTARDGGLAWPSSGATVEMAAPNAAIDPAGGSATWVVDLRHGEEMVVGWTLRVRAATADAGAVAPGTAGAEAADAAAIDAGAAGAGPVGIGTDGTGLSPLVAAEPPLPWVAPSAASPDPRLGRLVAQALDDIASLRMAERAHPQDVFVAAGAPWFMTMFGRDSIWAARMLLPLREGPLGVALAETTLRALARRQGTRVDDASCEQPGKIMHELRRADTRFWPAGAERTGPAVYYGTVDATPLWINLLADAWRAGMPADTVASFLPYLREALTWITAYGDPTGKGFVSYLDTTGRGLANQGWKDSGTAVRFRDGTMATGPIALCEVQAYAHRAALDAADLLDALGEPDTRSAQCREYASGLAERFRDRFWVDGPLGAHPALALDRDGRPVDALTSNIGHLLGTGLLSADEESQVARLLGTPALAGGYGLRTMSDIDAAFDPMSYHCGSIWPHDTAIALMGLATMPDDPDARATTATLTEGLLAAAEAFQYRLPELYGGEDRDASGRPLPHPAACRPQAWSAAAAVVLATAKISDHGELIGL